MKTRLVDHNFDPDDIRQFRGIRDLLFRRAKYRILVGHNPFGMGHLIPGKVEYFTMFRNPVERAISHYYFVRQPHLVTGNMSNWEQQRLHQRVPLKQIFEATKNKRAALATTWLLDNLQTRYTAGYRHTWRGENSRALLQLAKKNLRENYRVWGFQESFEESLVVIAEQFGWSVGTAVEPKKATRIAKDYDEEDLLAVRRYNQLDEELYTFARELFESRFGFAKSRPKSSQPVNPVSTLP